MGGAGTVPHCASGPALQVHQGAMPALQRPPRCWAVPRPSGCSSWPARCTPAARTPPALTAGCPLLQLQQQPCCWGQSRSLPSDRSVKLRECMPAVVLAVVVLAVMGGHSCMAVGSLQVQAAQLLLQSACPSLEGHSWRARGWLVLAAALHLVLSHCLLLERCSWIAAGLRLVAAAQLSS